MDLASESAVDSHSYHGKLGGDSEEEGGQRLESMRVLTGRERLLASGWPEDAIGRSQADARADSAEGAA